MINVSKQQPFHPTPSSLHKRSTTHTVMQTFRVNDVNSVRSSQKELTGLSIIDDKTDLMLLTVNVCRTSQRCRAVQDVSEFSEASYRVPSSRMMYDVYNCKHPAHL